MGKRHPPTGGPVSSRETPRECAERTSLPHSAGAERKLKIPTKHGGRPPAPMPFEKTPLRRAFLLPGAVYTAKNKQRT